MKKDTNNKISTIFLMFRYAEDQHTSQMIYRSKSDRVYSAKKGGYFPSVDEALESLALELYFDFKERCYGLEHLITKECCKKNSQNNNKYCPECGRLLKVDFDPEVFENYLCQLALSTLDSYGYFEENIWCPCNLMQKILKEEKIQNMVFVEHSAEKILTYYLAKAFEDINSKYIVSFKTNILKDEKIPESLLKYKNEFENENGINKWILEQKTVKHYKSLKDIK